MTPVIPKWKFWLSYLFEIHLESRESEINDTLHLILSRGRFQLYTENAIYSFEDLYDNFFQAFKDLHLDRLPTSAEVLILGYGMASIPLMLEKKFQKNYKYTGVDIDEEIIDLANQYILPRIKSPQQLIYADAQSFINSTSELYDMIIVDLFIDDLVPTKFEKTNFLEQVKNQLKPGGLVLYNRLANSEFTINQADLFLSDIFKPIFPEAHKITVADNVIIVSDENYIKP